MIIQYFYMNLQCELKKGVVSMFLRALYNPTLRLKAFYFSSSVLSYHTTESSAFITSPRFDYSSVSLSRFTLRSARFLLVVWGNRTMTPLIRDLTVHLVLLVIFLDISAVKCRDTLASGSVLRAGDYLVSNNNAAFVIMQDDGNLVVYRGSGPSNNLGHLWDSVSVRQGASYVIMQADCNLVVYHDVDGPSWNSRTVQSNGSCHAVMQNDMNFVVYKNQGTALWSSFGGRIDVVSSDGTLTSGEFNIFFPLITQTYITCMFNCSRESVKL